MKPRLGMSILIMLIVACFMGKASISQAQGLTTTTIKVGYFNPKDAKAGFIFGVNYGVVMDETVDLGVGVDLFRKTYTKQSVIAEQVSSSGVTEKTVEKELEYTTTILPIRGTVTLKLPASSYSPIFYYFQGGLGYGWLFNKENNFKDNVSESRTYHGFNWIVSAGVMYRVGSRSSLIAEVLYNGSKVSRNKRESTQGLPVWDEVNLSGLGIKLGIRFGVL